MKPRYTVIIYTPQDLNHSSYMQTGLFELENMGLIRCELKIDISKKVGRISTETGKSLISNHPQQKTSFYKLIDHYLSKEFFFAGDLYDISHFFSQYALENCDFIFKRNYVSKDIDCLESEFKNKIYPMGLTLGVQGSSRKFWGLLKLSYFFANLNLQLKLDRNLIKRIRNVISHTSRHIEYVTRGRSIDLLEKTPESTELNVFYQVRCFPQIHDENVKIIHRERSSLIRLLKNQLNDFYLGGIVPGEISNTYYKDCLTTLPTDPVSYIAQIKKSSICIYTKGLQNSPARKLSEYLSQGKCIVAERFETELPVPLENGKNIIYFDSPEHCVEICKELLKNPKKVKLLSKNARVYFETHVHPVKNVKRILELMLNHKIN
ncbi:glycosyltransferase [Winogradskyella pacifica]|uniref:glycosyltransferase n=1 Tax=Winogradskyella pacifica TaxID=664642 RepID=UPI0015C9EABC|nr:glycosyltransferase [Winogradskyella pacifica]